MKRTLLALCSLLLAQTLLSGPTRAQGPNYPIYLPLVAGAPSTPTPGTLVILANHTQHVDSSGVLHILGEVQNNTSSGVLAVEVSVVFLDANHQPVLTWPANVPIRILPSGEKTCFELSLSASPNWSYEFEAPVGQASTQGRPPLSLSSVNGQADSLGDYQITGFIRNDGSRMAMSVSAIGTLYDSTGHVTACGSRNANIADFDPGQSSAFTINFWGVGSPNAASYHVQADAMSY